MKTLYMLVIGFISSMCSLQGNQFTLNERVTYEDLINVNAFKLHIPAFKNHRISQLQALAALVINEALTRIQDISEQDSSGFKKLLAYTAQEALEKGKTDYTRNAFKYAIEDFNRQIIRDNARLKGIEEIAQLTLQAKNNLISLELEELNERYTPIIAAIKKLKDTTPLPLSLTLEAIHNFNLDFKTPTK